MSSFEPELALPGSCSEGSERPERPDERSEIAGGGDHDGFASGAGDLPRRIDEPLRLVHHHPGYLRIQAAGFMQPAGDGSVVAAAQTAAEAVSGVRSWSHNPKTGSVVVKYDPGTVEADDLLAHIAKRAGFRGVENATTHKRNRGELVSVFLDTVQDVNQVVSQLAAERADLRELVPIALAATSVVSFVLNNDRGRLPEWSGAAYHSYRVFMHWHRREVRERERVARQNDERGTAGRKRDDAR